MTGTPVTTSALSLRERMLKAGTLPSESLTVTLNGEDLVMDIRGLSAGARGRLLNTVMTQSDEDGERKIDLAKLTPLLVLECAFDPETGKKIFSPADFEVLSGLSANALDPIIAVASRLSGLGEQAMVKAERD